MNKKALLAICIAVLIPLISYLVLKSAGDNAVDMPRHYLPDSVQSYVQDGKMITDTVWHTVANITLQNQLGDTVNLYDIKGKVIVADFIFTTCGYICPRLTTNMVKMQQSFLRGGNPVKKPDTSIVQFISFTIDPERDSVPVLKAYADKFNVNHDNWWMLTGQKTVIYDFIFNELKVDQYSAEGPLDPDFAHTQRFVLLDKNYQVRGFYNGLDTAALSKLSKDIGLLMLEKDTTPGNLPFDPIQMAVFFVISIILVIVILSFLFRKKSIPQTTI